VVPPCSAPCVEHGSSRYRSGRSKTWLKTKCFTESTFVVIGTARERKTGAPLASLARANGQGLVYANSAFITLSGNEREEFWSRLETIKVGRCAAKFRLRGKAGACRPSTASCWRKASPAWDCERIDELTGGSELANQAGL